MDRLKAELDTHYAHLNAMGGQSQQAELRARRLEAEIEALKQANGELAASAMESKTELEKKVLAFDAMSAQRAKDAENMKEQIRKLQEQLNARERECDMFKKSAAQFEEKAAAAAKKEKEMGIELATAGERIEEQRVAMDKQEQVIADLKARLADLEKRPLLEDKSEYIDRLEKRLAELERRYQEMGSELVSTQEKLESSESQVGGLRKELVKTSADLLSKESVLRGVEKELDGEKVRVADLLKSNEDLSKISNDMVSTINDLEESKKKLEERIKELEKMLEEAMGNTDEADKWKKIVAEKASMTKKTLTPTLTLTLIDPKSEPNPIWKEATIEKLTGITESHKTTIKEQEDKLHENRLTIENLREDMVEAKEIQGKLEEEIRALKAKLKEAEAKIKSLEEERAKVDVLMEKTKMEAMKSLKMVEEKKEEISNLKKEVAKKDKTILDLMEKHAKNLEKAKQEALEKTMQSMVRLCVVAPTVNVSFGSEALTCKAGLPGEKIHEIIEKQILPGFIQLFLQPKEGLGPDGGQLSKWVERLMGDMQGSIEKHLAGVFSQSK